MRSAVYYVWITIALCGLASADQPPASTTEAKAVDTAAKTAYGATFTLPKSWTLVTGPHAIVATPPETDSHIAIVDIDKATDAKAAAAGAWAHYRPDAKRPLKLISPLAARNGWDERQSLEYETSPNERAEIDVEALRKGGHWTVIIFDGSQATAEKRSAAVGLIFDSLRPQGYQRETFAGRTPHPLDKARIGALTSFLRSSMNTVGVPGVGVALVEHGKVVFEGGLGVRELGKSTPVDEHTLFMIASNTKGMSTLLLAELVDEGKLSWDQPVTSVYPAFRLGSEATTRSVLIKHLVCACTGLPRKDLEWFFNTHRDTPATATFDQLAKTEPTSAFGEVYQYNNLMASAAGYIGGHLVYPQRELGAAYDSAMQEKVFDPLQMTETTFDMARVLAGNHASPHGDDIDGKPAVASMDSNYTLMPYRPAGGAWSTAHDLIKYVQNELALGKLPNGRQLVSSKNILARRARGVPTGEDTYYGMGLKEDITWGVPVIHHGGSMSGFKSDIIFLPDAGVGAVLLTNADDGYYLLRPFMRRLLEVLYDGKPEAVGEVNASAATNQAQVAEFRKRLAVPPKAQAVAALAASYDNPELGHLSVHRDREGAVFDFGLWSSRVATRDNDDGTTSFITIDPTLAGDDGAELVVAESVGKRNLIIRDGQHEYIYTEVQ